jgi:hypothetical protein
MPRARPSAYRGSVYAEGSAVGVQGVRYADGRPGSTARPYPIHSHSLSSLSPALARWLSSLLRSLARPSQLRPSSQPPPRPCASPPRPCASPPRPCASPPRPCASPPRPSQLPARHPAPAPRRPSPRRRPARRPPVPSPPVAPPASSSPASSARAGRPS